MAASVWIIGLRGTTPPSFGASSPSGRTPKRAVKIESILVDHALVESFRNIDAALPRSSGAAISHCLIIMFHILKPLPLVQQVSKRFMQAEGARVPGLHEPLYLAELRPKVGYYERLNLSLKGYDFVVLEKYQSYVNRRMVRMKFQVTKAWASPNREIQLDLLTDRSTAIESSYKIKIYERNIGMENALVTKLPILIDLLHHTTPPGVTFSIDRHSSADEDRLYFRDSVLEKFKEDLEELKATPLIGA